MEVIELLEAQQLIVYMVLPRTTMPTCVHCSRVCLEGPLEAFLSPLYEPIPTNLWYVKPKEPILFMVFQWSSGHCRAAVSSFRSYVHPSKS